MAHRLVIGVDHRGFELKQALLHYDRIGVHTIDWQDVGTFSPERTDYPQFAHKAVQKILAGEADGGILACGSGIGIAIAANRFKGIYAGVVWNEEVARSAKEDDNCNMLVLPADFIRIEEAVQLIDAWLSATFKQGRYQDRLEQIDSP